MGYSQTDNRASGTQTVNRSLAAALFLALGACSSLGATGPTAGEVNKAAGQTIANSQIQIIDVTYPVASRVQAVHQTVLFSQAIGDAPLTETIIGAGDILDVSIWEAPPAVLFGGNATFSSGSTASVLESGSETGQKVAIPAMMVGDDGTIRIPFAGAIRAVGRTPQQVEREIRSRLAGKAHDPQVVVRIATNASSNVTVVGEVANNTRVPLTPRGERLLDVLATAGGVKQPVNKVTIQVTRGDRVAYLPLASIIGDPAQNIRLGPNDVVTALYQPFSFTALGQTSSSAEIPFESTGLTLAEALARVGGLKDERANVRGAFIFRFEDPAALDPAVAAVAPRTAEGRIPVIYRVDMSDPATFFVAQRFPIADNDVLYVSRAPLADLQRFVSIIGSLAFPVINLGRNIP